MSNFRAKLKQFFWIIQSPKLVKSWIGWLPVGFEDLSNQEMQCLLLSLKYWRTYKAELTFTVCSDVEKAYLPEISSDSVDRISRALSARLNECMRNRARFGGDARRFSEAASKADWEKVATNAAEIMESHERREFAIRCYDSQWLELDRSNELEKMWLAEQEEIGSEAASGNLEKAS